jgi:hypothetical protein
MSSSSSSSSSSKVKKSTGKGKSGLHEQTVAKVIVAPANIQKTMRWNVTADYAKAQLKTMTLGQTKEVRCRYVLQCYATMAVK